MSFPSFSGISRTIIQASIPSIPYYPHWLNNSEILKKKIIQTTSWSLSSWPLGGWGSKFKATLGYTMRPFQWDTSPAPANAMGLPLKQGLSVNAYNTWHQTPSLKFFRKSVPWRECCKGPSVSTQTSFQIHALPGVCRFHLFKFGNLCQDRPSLGLVGKLSTAAVMTLVSTDHSPQVLFRGLLS